MKRYVLFILFLLTFSEVDAQQLYWGEKYCWGCRRYMDLTQAGYDAIPYGYEDNLNYPDRYSLPLNYYFNYRPATRRDLHNYHYFLKCFYQNPTSK